MKLLGRFEWTFKHSLQKARREQSHKFPEFPYFVVRPWVGYGILSLGVLLLLIGCTSGRDGVPTRIPTGTLLPPTPEPTQVPPEVQVSATSTPEPTRTAVPPTLTQTQAETAYPTPDLSSRPLIWFAPLPPLSIHDSRPFIGSEDFMDLFKQNATWTEASKHVNVFKLYGEWVEDVPWTVHASDAELKQVITDLNRRGIALAVEMGPLEPDSTCGQGIEGFAGIQAGVNIARRIKNAGGTLKFVSFDEPFAFASLYDGPNACRWSAEKVAQEVLKYIQAVRKVFPDVVFGDTEPLWSGVGVDEFKRWIDIYEDITGSPLSFLHLDQDFTRPDWQQDTLALEAYAREHGVEFGLIYLGDSHASTDEDWLSAAGERVIAYEEGTAGRPDHVLFQSWHDHPDRVLPETEPYSFTWFINTYFKDRDILGFKTEGEGANLAFGKLARASRILQGFEAERAIDRNTDTWWGSGAPPPQWIEIDLGSPYAIAEVNLLVSQYPAGETVHKVFVRGPGTGGSYLLLHTFSEFTADLDWLNLPITTPLEDIRYIRIETVSSPSWVGWREIEVIAAQ